MPALHALTTGLVFGESPRWHENRLWCIDAGAQEVLAVDLAGTREVIARVPTGLSAIDFLPDGRLLLAPGAGRQLLRRERDGTLVPHADLTHLSAHPWTDMVVDGRGNAYVGNLCWDLPHGAFRPGIVALVTPDGKARQVADGLHLPNGMVVTPDNAMLIVAETRGARLTAFDIGADGSLANRRVWADLPGRPDGICLDAEHAIWYAHLLLPRQLGEPLPARGRCVRVREGGTVLQTIDTERRCYACMLGGANGRTLFLLVSGPPDVARWGTSDQPRTGQVLTSEAPSAGAGWPKGTGEARG